MTYESGQVSVETMVRALESAGTFIGKAKTEPTWGNAYGLPKGDHIIFDLERL